MNCSEFEQLLQQKMCSELLACSSLACSFILSSSGLVHLRLHRPQAKGALPTPALLLCLLLWVSSSPGPLVDWVMELNGQQKKLSAGLAPFRARGMREKVSEGAAGEHLAAGVSEQKWEAGALYSKDFFQYLGFLVSSNTKHLAVRGAV